MDIVNIKYSQGMRTEVLRLNLSATSYEDWKQSFIEKDLWVLSEDTFLTIVNSLQKVGYYLSKPFSLHIIN